MQSVIMKVYRGVIIRRCLSTDSNIPLFTKRVLTSISPNGVATVSLNRPEKMNGLDMDMFKSIVSTIEELKANKGIRCCLWCTYSTY